MSERDEYIQKLEAEQQEATARFREIQAQADLAQSEDELQVLTGARALQNDVDREIQALRAADQRDWERVKERAEKARLRFSAYVDRAGLQWNQLRDGYRRKREAELDELGAQVDGWEATHQRGSAETSLLTRRELEFVKRGLRSSGDLLRNMRHSRGQAWKQAREEYESAWRDLREHYRRIRAEGGSDADQAPPP
ncbi:sll1863 family stress response protein [Corallococcus silvisoli]|uniref:hypothetical protein n=1 Tax=Corallococcus silvisoli TaxID=2697031 RepID=UPI001377E154|nr:hypothetical protein [Corallococcus silvisoli]NBD12402.1 hypothetical protein [Corallococcus silvisoli]